MYSKHQAMAIGILMGVIIEFQGCAQPALPDLSGTHLAHGADIQGDEKNVEALKSVFRRAEDALHRRDLNALMDLYSERYKHGGYTKDSVKAVWKDLFEHNHDFSDTHIFSKIKVEVDKTQPQAQITCTGSLWAISNDTGERVNIDSWYGEVHYLMFEQGTWRLAGHFWEIPRAKETRPTLLPHPFF
jgi:hypothetical protein